MSDSNQTPRRPNPFKRFRFWTGEEPTEPYTMEEYQQAEDDSYLGTGIPGRWLDSAIQFFNPEYIPNKPSDYRSSPIKIKEYYKQNFNKKEKEHAGKV